MTPLIAITGRRIAASTLKGLDARWATGQVDMFWAEFGTKIAEAGGIPVQLPYESSGADVVERMDALVVTGGQDVDPGLWGGPESRGNIGGEVLKIDRRRDDYEIALVRHALARRIPVLGVCRGLQVLNVALGGTLVPHLPDTGIQHVSSHGIPDERPDKEHPVDFTAGTLAAQLYGARAAVNSWHHQAADRLGDGLVASGYAPDGVIEAIEIPGRPVLGVQWHPEMSTEMEPCFPWLVAAARAEVLAEVPS
ncbi:MAG TPA: gamma-glutamyl-gamma-aminobutyrate hydrolase family protein [Nocardioides sp.]|nr:gamma-glutamyl-gamma-aminobutyrate hydrolase family protein [Nocardioides sp.]